MPPRFFARSRLRRLASVLAVAGLAGCTSGPAPLEEHRAAAAQTWQRYATAERPVAVIAWTDAVQRMEARNIKLLQAREAVRAGEEAVRMVPRNYIPELSLNVFAYPTFRMLGDGGIGDTFLYVGSIVSLPDPIRYRAEALQARLQYMSAQAEGEVLRRDLHVKLYRLFRRAAHIRRDEAALSALTQLGSVAPTSAAALQARELEQATALAWQALEPELAELLGDASKHWRPGPASGLPPLDYAAAPPALDGSRRFASLHLTRAALQLLALDAQRQGLLVAEWPQVSVLLSAPPLYQRASGRDSYLSLGDLRVSGFISYSTDFRGRRALSRAQAARQAEIARTALNLAMAGLVARLQDGAAALAGLDARRAGLQQAEAALRQSGAVAEAIGVARTLDETADEIDEFNFSFWVLDDPRWGAAP